ncbi:MAG: hypothetical protein VB110_07440 [Bacteroidales bacterium]|nr:hypothetical protein [Bacteroidales bacterium]
MADVDFDGQVQWTQTWTSGDGGYAAAQKGAVLFTCTNGAMLNIPQIINVILLTLLHNFSI